MMNPEQIKQEQERVKGLLEGATNPDSWYWQPGWGLQCYFPDGLGLLVPDEQKAGDMLLMEAAPRLARAYLTLLDAHLARASSTLAGGKKERPQTERKDTISMTQGFTERPTIGTRVTLPEGIQGVVWSRSNVGKSGVVYGYRSDREAVWVRFDDGVDDWGEWKCLKPETPPAPEITLNGHRYVLVVEG